MPHSIASSVIRACRTLPPRSTPRSVLGATGRAETPELPLNVQARARGRELARAGLLLLADGEDQVGYVALLGELEFGVHRVA